MGGAPAHSFTLSVEIVRAIVAEAVSRGARAEDVLAVCGASPELLADVDGRVPARMLVRLWDEVPRMVGDACFGLHLGERAASALTFPGRVFAASATLGEGLTRLLALQRLVNDVHRTERVVDGGLVCLRARTKSTPLPAPAHAIDFVFAWMVATARAASGKNLTPARVRLEHERRGDAAEYRRVLGCPVELDAEHNELAFHASALDTPHVTRDPALVELLESRARLLLAQLPDTPSFAARVRDAIVPLLERGATIDRVAGALRVSERSVQRYLQSEGTTFAALVDDVRRRRAEIALAERTTSIAELSRALGFADQSAFHKAFVRWTGRTPGAFRRSSR